MPIIKSAIKRARQEEKRRARNVTVRRRVRTEAKALENAVAAKDGKKAQEQLKAVQSAYDTAVKKNIVSKNKAARKVASYSAMVKGVSVKKAPAKPAAAKKPIAKKAD